MELSPVVLPFACLPNVEYMSWMIHSAGLNIEVHETFPKQTCRNRYAILTAEGPFMLTIPVKRPGGNHTPFKEVLLDDPAKWVNNHWRAIESAYNKSPFFLYYRDVFEKIFRKPPDTLFELNFQFLNTLNQCFDIKPSFQFTTKFIRHYPPPVIDMRDLIMPKQDSAQQFPRQDYPPYIQAFSHKLAFAPNLSSLDLLFNLGPESVDYLTRIYHGNIA
jgi:hypothetical protein